MNERYLSELFVLQFILGDRSNTVRLPVREFPRIAAELEATGNRGWIRIGLSLRFAQIDGSEIVFPAG